MRVRRVKPYVCVDCDYAEHFRFQDTKDVDAAAGTWLRCLTYSRAQEQDGLVKASWLQRTFATTYERVEDLVRVGLLRLREDGDYELHAYAPRNQTRAMLEEERGLARERMASARNAKTSTKRRRSPEQTPNKRRTSALVPTSTSSSIKHTSTSSSPCSSPSSGVSVVEDPEIQGRYGIHEGGPGGAGAAHPRTPLPASERGLSGSLWLQAFTDGVADHTRRPCTAGRVYVSTLERLVSHHAPQRDAPSACAWLREQARAFAVLWDGKHPAKGLTPDGLERWLNDGRQGPPEFGRPRIVQPTAEDWHEDDWSDLGAEVVR